MSERKSAWIYYLSFFGFYILVITLLGNWLIDSHGLLVGLSIGIVLDLVFISLGAFKMRNW